MAGIYIHIPFCKQACTYCNFHFSTSLAGKSEMIAAIEKEIALTIMNPEHNINTIYFGGGTPSLLTIDEIKTLLEAVGKKFSVADDVEITLEANPDDVDPATLIAWQGLGINRLSVGIQSFQENELRWMNRAHNAVDSIKCIEDIRASGITNFSVDLIYGSPLLSDEDFKKNVELILSYHVPHISCYALTVEPNTALDHLISKKKSPPVDNEKQSAHFLLLMDWLRNAGYEHYEISNFSKPGMHSRHNSSYWSGVPYYGFGPSAHSFNGFDTRRWNVANNALYVNAIKTAQPVATEERLTVTQRLNEYIMISLRTSRGLLLNFVEDKFGIDHKARIVKESQKYMENGKMTYENGILLLTDEGKLLADGIAAHLFF